MPFLDVVAGTLPAGNECYPQTPQELLDLFSDYQDVDFNETYSLFVTGPGPIDVGDQDKIWFERDADQNPISIRSFDTNLGEWISFFPSHGTTANRPVSPDDYQLYFDTTINAMLIYERAAWRTADGSPGDIKFVTAASSGAAITNNPGWIEYTAMRGRSPMGAGTGVGLTNRVYGTEYGEETHILTASEFPQHSHTYKAFDSTGRDGDNGSPVVGHINTGNAVENTSSYGEASPDGFNIVGPVLALWCLIKE